MSFPRLAARAACVACAGAVSFQQELQPLGGVRLVCMRPRRDDEKLRLLEETRRRVRGVEARVLAAECDRLGEAKAAERALEMIVMLDQLPRILGVEPDETPQKLANAAIGLGLDKTLSPEGRTTLLAHATNFSLLDSFHDDLNGGRVIPLAHS